MENNMTHTPGPLQVHWEYDLTGYPVYSIHGLAGDAKRDKNLLDQYARLIESAPDLLVALENIIDWLERTGEDKSTFGKTYDYVVTAKEAIRKAKGS